MAGNTAEIIARLTLKGEQFSSETGRVFAAMEAQARDTAGRTRSAFEGSFREIQQLASKAVTMPRAAGGGLNVDVSGARQAAATAQLQAAALREIATAAAQAAAKTGDTTENTRLYVQAARSAAVEAEREAQGLRTQAMTLERLQVELNGVAAARTRENAILSTTSTNHQRQAQNLGLLRAGYQQLSFQIGDVGQQLALGTPLATVFAQQAGQVVQAISMIAGSGGAGGGQGGAAGASGALDAMTGTLDEVTGAVESAAGATETLAGVLGSETAAAEGSSAAAGANAGAKRGQATASGQSAAAARVSTAALGADAVATEADTVATNQLAAAKGRLAGFLAGPWGAAVIGGITVLAMFLPKLIGTKDATAEAVEKMKDQHRQTLLNAEAERMYGLTIDGVTESLKKQTDELERQNRTMEETVRLQQQSIRNDRGKLAERRAAIPMDEILTRRDLEGARERLSLLQRSPADESTGAAIAGQVDEIERLEKKLADLGKEAGALDRRIAEADRALRQAGFPLAERAAREATDKIAAINGQYDRMRDAAKAAASGNDALAASLDRTLTAIEKQRAAALAAEEKRRRVGRNGGPDADLTAFKWPVASRANSGEFNEPRPGHRHAGVDIPIPVGSRVGAAAAGTIIEAGTLPGYGNVIIIDHGRGVTTRYAHLSKLMAREGEFVDQGERIGLSGGARGAPGSGNSRGAHLHYEVRQGGKPVDPRKGQFAIDTFAVQEQAEQARQRQLEQEAEQRDRILAASRAQLDVDVESARFLGMRILGLEDEAEIEREVAGIRRDAVRDLAQLTAEQRQQEERVTEGLDEQIQRYRDQGAALAQLIGAHGDREKLTDQQKKVEQETLAAMLAQLEAARAIATTRADQQRIEEAIARVQHQLVVTEEKTERATRKAADEAEKSFRKETEARERQMEAEKDRIATLADFYRDAFKSGGRSIVEDFKDEMLDVIAEVAARWTLALLSGQKTSLGGILQQMGATSNGGGSGGLLSALFGGGSGGGAGGTLAGLLQKAPGGGIGGGMPKDGAAGAGLWDSLSSVLSSGQGGAASGAGGLAGMAGSIGQAMPYAAAAMAAGQLMNKVLGIKDPTGGLLGPLGALAVNAFIPSKRGSATVGFNPYGELGVTSTRGNSDKRIAAATDLAGGLTDTLSRIADALGGDLRSVSGISFGVREGNFRLDPSGRGITKTKNGAIDFGEDQEAMIREGVRLMLERGVVDGISQASKNILASGQDLERAIEKAAMIEDIPRQLAARLDPVGAQLDKLIEKWTKTIAALKEGGASAEQMADAQKLYKLELEETKATAREASADLRAFQESLNFGSSSPYSLRDQESMARAALQPFLDKIGAGEAIDQGAYQEAASGWLEIERQLYGSTAKFFDAMDVVQAATSKAIATIDNAKPIRTFADPFAETTAQNTGAAAELLADLRNRAAAGNELLGQILGRLGGGGGFVGGDGRGFTARSVSY